ncbi:MAG: WYL domain-containing protein [Deltaproteobacteria bacterium]|nr:WYL domain-containing protein [Deltaproteobacteria bacterium]
MAAKKRTTRGARTGRKRKPDLERNAQIVRVLRVLRDLDRLGGVDLYELAERYGTTTRTVRRDLEALKEAGVAIREEGTEERRKRWRVDYRDQLRKVWEVVDASHYLALRLAMDQAGATRRASALFATLEDLADKIEESVGEKGRKLIDAIDRSLYSYDKFAYQSAPPDVFWKLVSAIGEQRLCHVGYRAPRVTPHETNFRALPLKLFAHAGALYLHAFVPRHGNVIAMNLHRLVELEVLDEKGTPPADYDPSKWEASAFGIFLGTNPVQYRLRFDPDAAPYVRERTWHPSQKLKELRDGRLELAFQCTESYEVTSWVVSWQTAVEVLEPESLRRELASFGGWAVDRYGGG